MCRLLPSILLLLRLLFLPLKFNPSTQAQKRLSMNQKTSVLLHTIQFLPPSTTYLYNTLRNRNQWLLPRTTCNPSHYEDDFSMVSRRTSSRCARRPRAGTQLEGILGTYDVKRTRSGHLPLSCIRIQQQTLTPTKRTRSGTRPRLQSSLMHCFSHRT